MPVVPDNSIHLTTEQDKMQNIPGLVVDKMRIKRHIDLCEIIRSFTKPPSGIVFISDRRPLAGTANRA